MRKMPPRFSAESLCAACAAVAIGACVIVIGSPACGPTCDTTNQNNPEEPYEGGTVIGGADPYYVSSDWQKGLLHFPGGKRYRLVHHLGFVPLEVSVYVSFADRDQPLTECAGNTCVIEAVRDDAIIVKNDTCSEFWIRVVASGGFPGPSDAGSDAGAGLDSASSD